VGPSEFPVTHVSVAGQYTQEFAVQLSHPTYKLQGSVTTSHSFVGVTEQSEGLLLLTQLEEVVHHPQISVCSEQTVQLEIPEQAQPDMAEQSLVNWEGD